MVSYNVQYARLKRHYDSAITNYDIISFLDLAHTLRVWTELKNKVTEIKNENIFKIPILTKKFKKLLTGGTYVFCHLPSGVTTNSVNRTTLNQQEIISGPAAEKFSTGTFVKFDNDTSMTRAQFFVIHRVLSPEEVKIMNDESHKMQTQRVNFAKYLESPAIKFNVENCNAAYISNEELIKRIANEYDASHPSNSDSDFEVANIFSGPTKKMMQYKCAKLPLPYFITLHIAKNILDQLESTFER
ncbi:hypothetical protein JXA48_03450 [Candidatus Woesearchaeota archaeon]|nr:hypothetical protein [Candidatus Woesearchaeota archaeon]